jgi:hypothetical protein
VTFKNRGTTLSESDRIFSDEFKSSRDREKQWQAFLRKSQLNLTESFRDILNQIELFILPVVKSVINKKSSNENWEADIQKWVKK